MMITAMSKNDCSDNRERIKVTKYENGNRDPLTPKIIKACYQVHNQLGPGFNERIYANALKIELEGRRGMGSKFLLSTPSFILPHQRGRRLHGGNFKYFCLVFG